MGQFLQWKNSGHAGRKRKVQPDFRPIVYCQAIKHGNESDWHFIWELYKVEEDSIEKSTLLKALTCTRSVNLTNKLLFYTKNGSYIGVQEGPLVFIYLCRNNQLRDIMWNFIEQEWDWISSTYGQAFFIFRKLIYSCISFFSTKENLLKLETFIQTNKDKLGLGAVAFVKAVEEVKMNIAWRKRNENTLHEWLKSVKV